MQTINKEVTSRATRHRAAPSLNVSLVHADDVLTMQQERDGGV